MTEFSLYEPFGLNKMRSLLSPTQQCNICGEKNYLKIDDIEDFAINVLEYELSALFVVTYFKDMIAYIYCDDEIISIVANENSLDFFAICDADYRLFGYSLVIEREPGIWEII